MNNFHIVAIQPSDLYFHWQVKLQLYNFRKFDYSKYYRCLIFIPADRAQLGVPQMWRDLENEYPEAHFSYYFDDGTVLNDINRYQYVSLLRPHCFSKHLEEYPELTKDSIFYLDSDVLFLKPLDFLSEYLDQNICYLSDTKSYLNSDYFDSKRKDVIPQLLDRYDQRDILEEVASICGINRKICEDNKDRTGGAQYLFAKNTVDSAFFKKVYYRAAQIRNHLMNGVNKEFFPSENIGFQSWAISDMNAVLYGLWEIGAVTETPSNMNFCWATDHISKWDTTYIFHLAGAGPEPMRVGDVDHQIFYKGFYSSNQTTPFDDKEEPYLLGTSPEFCSYNYINEILEYKKHKLLLTP